MSHPARQEIENHAKNEFAVAQERIAVKHAGKWRRVLVKVAATGNMGGYAPALTESKARHVRQQIIALADAYARTFDLFGVPSDTEAESNFEVGAQQIAAGSNSAVLGELDLLQGRVRMIPLPGAENIYRVIQQSMQSAINAGKLRLRRQRIKFASSTETAAVTKRFVGTSSNESAVGRVADAAEGTWHEYRAWFCARLEALEAMAARTDPLHLPLDEQDAQRFSTNATKQRFDELAEDDYRQWVTSGLPHETFSARLSELHAQVSTASIELWSLGSKILGQWYKKNCQRSADSELSGKVRRWEHRARTTEIVRNLSQDGGLALGGLIVELAKLTAEEDYKVPGSEDKRRLRVYLYDVGHRFEGGYSGDFLERARLAIRDMGLQLGPPSSVPPLEFCLRMLFRELVCEREPLHHPEIARLNSEQLGRYLYAAYSGNSITPESGQVFNLCEALKWYCQRLRGLCQYELVDGIRIAEHGSADSPDCAKPLVRSRLEDAQSKVRAVAKSLTSGSQTLEQAAEELELEAKIWARDLHHALLREMALEGVPPEKFEERAVESAREIAALAADTFCVRCSRGATTPKTPLLIGEIAGVIDTAHGIDIDTRFSIRQYLERGLCDYPKQYLRQNLSVYRLTSGAGEGVHASAANGETGAGTAPISSEPVNEKSGPVESERDHSTRKKRGRPVEIPSTAKQAALRVRADGGTWKDAAKELYQTPYPSTQQVKNAPNVLKNYGRTAGPPPNKS